MGKGGAMSLCIICHTRFASKNKVGAYGQEMVEFD